MARRALQSQATASLIHSSAPEHPNPIGSDPQPTPGAHQPAAPLRSSPDAPGSSEVPALPLAAFALQPVQPLQTRPAQPPRPGQTPAIRMKAVRFVVRGAGTLSRASLVPREVEHFSRYSPSPLSMKQLLDFGERGRGAGDGWAGAGGLPEL